MYKIDNGEIFEGTVDQFKDCFFSNSSEKNVRTWCEQQGYKFEIYDLVCEYCKMPINDINELTWDKRNNKPSHRECYFQKYPGSKPLEFKEED